MNATDNHVCSTPLGTAHVYSSVPAIEDKRVQANTHAHNNKENKHAGAASPYAPRVAFSKTCCRLPEKKRLFSGTRVPEGRTYLNV